MDCATKTPVGGGTGFGLGVDSGKAVGPDSDKTGFCVVLETEAGTGGAVGSGWTSAGAPVDELVSDAES